MINYSILNSNGAMQLVQRASALLVITALSLATWVQAQSQPSGVISDSSVSWKPDELQPYGAWQHGYTAAHQEL